MQSVLIFDVETTGNNPAQDQVIELCIQSGFDESRQTIWRFKPDVRISPEAQQVHGISAEMLADCPRFSELAPSIRELFCGAQVLIGYNLEFDVSFIQSEFIRAGQSPLELRNFQLVDPFCIWRKMEPRRLSDAYKRFVGGEFDGAHSAGADVAATGKVFQGMLSAFALQDHSWEALAEMSPSSQKLWVGPSYHFQWKENEVVFGFGKHRNRKVLDVCAEDNGSYLQWLAGSDFPPHVKQIAGTAASKSADEFMVWVKKSYA